MDAEAKKILKGLWANSGDRVDPDSATINPSLVRTVGYTTPFSSTQTPRRQVVNQLLRELQGAAHDGMTEGLRFYDATVDYKVNANCSYLGNAYRAVTANGPSSTAVSPGDAGQTAWARISGQQNAPAAPGQPTATTHHSGGLEWVWSLNSDGGSAITSWQYRYRASGAANWSTVASVSHCRISQSGLTNGTTYEMQVRAVNTVGTSAWSATGSGTPTASVPTGGNSFGLRATPANASLEIDWFEPDNGGASITSYLVQWKSGTQAYSSGRQATVTGSTSYTLSSLTNGTAYTVRVRATNSVGNSSWSNEATGTPAAPAVTQAAPAAPVSVAAAVGNGSLRITWLPGRDNGALITGYTVDYRLGNSGSWSSATGAKSGHLLTGLTNGSSYQVRVRAINSVGNGAWSGVLTATPAGQAPDQVQGLTATAGAGQVSLAWGRPAANGLTITGYQVDYRISGSWTTVNLTGAATVSTTVTSLTNGSAYSFRVRAVTAGDDGAWSSTVTATPATQVPAQVEGVVLTSGPSRIDAEWTAPDNRGANITGYTVNWRAGNSGTWSTETVTSTEHAMTGLTNNTSYQVRVRAVNSVGNGAWSTTQTVTPAAQVPEGGNAFVLCAVAQDAAVRLDWNGVATNGAGLTGHTIQWKSGSQSYSSARQATATGVARTHTVSSLTNGTAYTFRIRATNAVGNSDWSNEVTATPQAGAIAPSMTLSAASSEIYQSAKNQLSRTLSGGTYDGTDDTWKVIEGSGTISSSGLYTASASEHGTVVVELALAAYGNGTNASPASAQAVCGRTTFHVVGLDLVGFVNQGSSNSDDIFRLCSLNFTTGALTAIGDKIAINSIVGNQPGGVSLLKDGATTYAAFVDTIGRDFRLCKLNLLNGTLTAVGNKQDISSIVGNSAEGVSLLKDGSTTYAAFVDLGDATQEDDVFRLCTVNLSTAALSAIGNGISIGPLVGRRSGGVSLLKDGSTTYAGFVDAYGDDFRLCTLNLSTAALTAVGSKQDISSLVGDSVNGCSLRKRGSTVYAAFVDRDGDDFRLCTLNLTNGALTAVGNKQDISSIVGSEADGVGLLV